MSLLRAINVGGLLAQSAIGGRFKGFGFIAGTVRIEGTPTRRRVRCTDRFSGRFIAEMWSGNDGSYRFDNLNVAARYQIVAMDYELQYNAVIADNVAPVRGGPVIAPPEPETLFPPVDVEAQTVSDDVLLTWRNTNFTQESVRVYRSGAPMDAESLPNPLASLDPFERQYLDDSAGGGLLYYRVGAVRGSEEVVSGDVVSAKHWRILINLTRSADAFLAALAEVQFRSVLGRAVVHSGGQPLASAEFGDGFRASEAFDNDPSTIWSTGDGDDLPQWIGYEFQGPKSVAEVLLAAGDSSARASRAPRDFMVQYSGNGVDWVTVLSRVDEPAWGSSEVRVYEIPGID